MSDRGTIAELALLPLADAEELAWQERALCAQTDPEALVRAYDQGKQDALRTNPVSMDLEMVCLNLWANKQPTPWEKR